MIFNYYIFVHPLWKHLIWFAFDKAISQISNLCNYFAAQNLLFVENFTSHLEANLCFHFIFWRIFHLNSIVSYHQKFLLLLFLHLCVKSFQITLIFINYIDLYLFWYHYFQWFSNFYPFLRNVFMFDYFCFALWLMFVTNFNLLLIILLIIISLNHLIL